MIMMTMKNNIQKKKKQQTYKYDLVQSKTRNNGTKIKFVSHYKKVISIHIDTCSNSNSIGFIHT